MNSVFVFSPDGLIQMATFNCPGSWHDSTISDCGICKKMMLVCNRCGGKAVVDSAFKLTKLGCLIQLPLADPILKNATHQEECGAIDLNTWATSLRQSSEASKQKMIMHVMILLCNCQTEKVGINQTLNSFMRRTKGFPLHSHAHSNNATELAIVSECARTIFQREIYSF